MLEVNNFTDCCALTTIVLNCRVPQSYTAVMVTSTCFILSNYCLLRALAEITIHDVCCDAIVFSSEIACDTELKRECEAVDNEALF